MTPIFAPDSELIGWLDGKYVFDIEMQWVAFTNGSHLFAAGDARWLGPLLEGSLCDRFGRPVGWLRTAIPRGGQRPLAPMATAPPMAPMIPMRPMNPMKPMRRMMPLGGWSLLDWRGWLDQ